MFASPRYASGVDVEFVRKSVRSIGRVAVKLERACERAMNVLLELIETKVWISCFIFSHGGVVCGVNSKKFVSTTYEDAF